jgi:chromosome segregation ATPase
MSIERIVELEEAVSKVTAMVHSLKEDKTRLEAEISRLQADLDGKKAVEEELSTLKDEKEEVRRRLEGILSGIESLTA